MCGQNWTLIDPTRRNKKGEFALLFVSHEDCNATAIGSASDLNYGQVLLQLMARSFCGAHVLDEVYF